MLCLYHPYLLWAETGGLLAKFIAITGFLVVGLGLALIVFLVISRKKQNELVIEQQKMKEQFQNQLLQSSIEVQEQTFHHISRELHDNVAQLLSSSRMLLGLTERSLANPPDTLLTANQTLAEAIHELRSLSKSLDKEWLSQFRLDENLDAEIRRINAGDGMQVVYAQRASPQLATDKQIILFRIVQEALQNAIKHARATLIRISAQESADEFRISIADNGQGFDTPKSGAGLGMKNMQQRTALLEGDIEWRQQQGGGTEVIIKIPVQNGK